MEKVCHSERSEESRIASRFVDRFGRRFAPPSQRHIISTLVVFITLALLFVAGCSFAPSITSNPCNLSMEIPPERGIDIQIGGLGTRVTKLAVRANGAPVKSLLDASGKLLVNGRRTLETDTRYIVDIAVKGNNGDSVEKTFAFLTATTPKPLISATPTVVKKGGAVEIRWNMPITSFKYELPKELDSYGELDKGGQVCKVTIRKYTQGQQYDLKIKDAVGMNGYHIKKHNPGFIQRVATTTPLSVDFDPGYGSHGVSRSTGIIVTFSEAVTNPQIVACTNILLIDPAVPGETSWESPNQLKFIPSTPWDFETDVTVTVKSGPDMLRGASGSFIEGDKSSFFTTGVYKSIDINLSTQTLTLLEGGTPVATYLVSTGKPGYDTPTGEYRVYSKDVVTPMGTTPEAAEFYYIPDVPYVLWFYGGYSIHGAYWHNEFGHVRSHGCVNLPVSDAEYVFGWAPVGTPINVHY